MSNIKPFLILQFRPEDKVADDEFQALLKFGGINEVDTRRVRLEREQLPVINLNEYSAIIVGGGPYCLSDDPKPPEQVRFEAELFKLMKEVVETDFPFLGACYGLSILSQYLGGTVSKEQYGETPAATAITLTGAAQDNSLTSGLPTSFMAFGGHKESCQDLAPGATLLASSETCPIHMISVKQNIYATQFHPELEKVGLALRVNFYRHKGYFPPEDADRLITAAEKVSITVPEKILRRFVSRYNAELP